MDNKLLIDEIVVLRFRLKLETGLHIGGNKDNYGIGGIDSPVIKNPFNNQPIIPGSSLKGKIRMLMETVETEDYSAKENAKAIKNMFGSRDQNKVEELNFTRVIFRDLSLTEESVLDLQSKLGDGFFTEIKAENKIDPITSKANPRFQERVPAGAIFEGECVIQFTSNDQDDYVEIIKDGFRLLENNYLGGSGSRGYGKVSVEFLS